MDSQSDNLPSSCSSLSSSSCPAARACVFKNTPPREASRPQPHYEIDTTPKLGDFSNLDLSFLSTSPSQNSPGFTVFNKVPGLECDDGLYETARVPTPATDDISLLGNFSKIFSTYGNWSPWRAIPDTEKTSAKLSSPEGVVQTPDNHVGPREASKSDEICLIRHLEMSSISSDSNYGFRFSEESVGSPDTTQTSPPTSPDHRSAPRPEKPLPSYTIQQHGPVFSIPESIQSQAERTITENLRNSYLGVCGQDGIIFNNYQRNWDNGVHVFVDTSNIHIGFIRALKERFNIPESARFTRYPTFDDRALSQLVIRNRRCRTRVAGCSVHPDRPEPAYIEDLRQMGYQVHIRERKRADKPKNGPCYDPWKGLFSPNEPHYVEDMVDEVLQLRIGETVMRYFQRQGTLVLVTGDGRPAEFSEGFHTYAKRALKMGWNVEVYSWKASCSSSWKDRAFTERWGNRFRLIELDAYLGVLWERQ